MHLDFFFHESLSFVIFLYTPFLVLAVIAILFSQQNWTLVTIIILKKNMKAKIKLNKVRGREILV